MPTTTDLNDSRLGFGTDDEPTEQNEAYLVLSDEERGKGFVRPYRNSYKHEICDMVTTMNSLIAETYARQPEFYGATYCTTCRVHAPVSEFKWTDDGSEVGS